ISRAGRRLAERCEQSGDRREAAAACRLLLEFNQGAKDTEARLPGHALAESKLAALEGPQSNPKTPR
ncbi:MAG: hypothetical protein ACO3ND_04510, partial [Opitutales bacterium]